MTKAIRQLQEVAARPGCFLLTPEEQKLLRDSEQEIDEVLEAHKASAKEEEDGRRGR